MKALITAEGNTATVEDVPIPRPQSKEIRVKVHSVALNPVDALYVAHPADKPGRVVGSDIAGIVDAIGDEVTQWHVGDRVAGLLQGATSTNARPGGFAEYAILEEDLTIRIPSKTSFEEAATLPLCSLTAAQALFIRLEINAHFPSPFEFSPPVDESPAILVYSAATSLGLFTVELAKLIRTPSGKPFRIFATASPKNHEKLLGLGVESVYEYRSPTWPADVRRDSGGISYAVDCISEDETTGLISQTFVDRGGRIAVIRLSAWNKESVRQGVIPMYGAAWSGLGHEIVYNGAILPGSPSWREFTVAFYKYLSGGSPTDQSLLPITPNPVRLMPGGLDGIVPDAFTLIGSGKVAHRNQSLKPSPDKSWMSPISAEKLVYHVAP